jgi:hypothetical protein
VPAAQVVQSVQLSALIAVEYVLLPQAVQALLVVAEGVLLT